MSDRSLNNFEGLHSRMTPHYENAHGAIAGNFSSIRPATRYRTTARAAANFNG